MVREDLLWLLPALGIALYQVFVLWRKFPKYKEEETEIQGEYNYLEKFQFDYLVYLAYFVFLLQLIFPLLPITYQPTTSFLLKTSGYVLIITGFLISVSAVRNLGSNWTGLQDYRVKKGQKLIKTGIYKLIRHPIYFAGIVESVGFELAANSWLFIPVTIIGFLALRKHIEKEEKLLEIKFGKDYLTYKKEVKKLIPFIY